MNKTDCLHHKPPQTVSLSGVNTLGEVVLKYVNYLIMYSLLYLTEWSSDSLQFQTHIQLFNKASVFTFNSYTLTA